MFVSRYLYLYVMARTWTSHHLLNAAVLHSYTTWLPIMMFSKLRIAFSHNTTCVSTIRSHIPFKVCERGMQKSSV